MKRTRVARSVLVAALALLSGFGLAQQTSEGDKPNVKQMTIPAVELTYLDQGQGDAVVFVHGAYADHRAWEAQREAVVAQGYRFIAPDLRYHGSSPLPDEGANYSLATHTSDVATFIQQLDVGPVHVVGLSYGSNVALVLTVQYPHLVRSLVLYEPAFDPIVSDPAYLETLGEEWGSNGAFAASQEGDQREAVRLFTDWITVDPGSFEALPKTIRTVFLENSRTFPLILSSPGDPPIICAQAGRIEVPVTVMKGEQTRPAFVIYSETAHECIPASQLVTIPDATHLAPVENTPAFNKALLSHLEGIGTEE